MSMTNHPMGWRAALALLAVAGLGATGCKPPRHTPAGTLPPAYTSNQITDPALSEIAEGIKSWGARQVSADKKPLYGKVEVLPPTPIVQPYGVGVFQAEPRLPVILTTGEGWAGLSAAEKETAVSQAFNHLQEALKDLRHATPLPPTLTVQTPQGMNLAWVNRLEDNGRNVHGDD